MGADVVEFKNALGGEVQSTPWQELAIIYMEKLDSALRDSLIGSKIIDFKVEKIPRTKHMYLITIETDAKPVKDGKATYITTPLKLRVRI
jgi:hypothetical protein